MRVRLAALHEQAAERSALTFVVSGKLAELEREAGREAQLVGAGGRLVPGARSRAARSIAVSLGHLGWRTDWALLRAVAEQMPELVLLLVGAWHEDECKDDADFAWCRAAPNLVWLGRAQRRGGGAADPLRRRRDPAVPRRAVQRRRRCPTGSSSTPASGRRTISPELAGVHTWDRAVTTARRRRRVRRGAARAGRRARCAPDARAARVGARADRRARQRPAVGAAARARAWHACAWRDRRACSADAMRSWPSRRCGAQLTRR